MERGTAAIRFGDEPKEVRPAPDGFAALRMRRASLAAHEVRGGTQEAVTVRSPPALRSRP